METSSSLRRIQRSTTKLQLLLINWAMGWVVREQSVAESSQRGNWRRLSIEYSKLVDVLMTTVRELSFADMIHEPRFISAILLP